MSQPLGFAVGNAIEVREAIECLKGGGPADLRELCVVLAGQVLRSAGLLEDDADDVVERALDDGSAYQRFEEWIGAQGGDVTALDHLPLAPDQELIRAERSGVVSGLGARAIGRAAGLLGGGRSRKGEDLDHGVGVMLHAKVGDPVSRGDPVATLYHRGATGLEDAVAGVAGAVRIAEAAAAEPLVIETGVA